MAAVAPQDEQYTIFVPTRLSYSKLSKRTMVTARRKICLLKDIRCMKQSASAGFPSPVYTALRLSTLRVPKSQSALRQQHPRRCAYYTSFTSRLSLLYLGTHGLSEYPHNCRSWARKSYLCFGTGALGSYAMTMAMWPKLEKMLLESSDSVRKAERHVGWT